MSGCLNYIFFDVAGTLLHKPGMAGVIQEVLGSHGCAVSVEAIKKTRARLAESTDFPVATTPEFYTAFNAKMLALLGCTPDAQIVEEINRRSKDVRWEKYPDAAVLDKIPVPVGIISNWDKTLPDVLEKHFTTKFFRIIYSEKEKVQKPDAELFRRAVFDIDLTASTVLYVGDSVRLDMLPAREAGFQGLLINRENSICDYGGESISSLWDVLSLKFNR